MIEIENLINNFIRKIEEDSFSSHFEVGVEISDIFAKVVIMKDDDARRSAIKDLYKIREAFARKGKTVDVYATDRLLEDLFKNGDINDEYLMEQLDKRLDANLGNILKKLLSEGKIENCANCGTNYGESFNKKQASVTTVKNFKDTILVIIEDKTLVTYEDLEVILNRVLEEFNVNKSLRDIMAVTSVNDNEICLYFNDKTKPITLDLKGVDMTLAEKGFYLSGFKQYIDKK